MRVRMRVTLWSTSTNRDRILISILTMTKLCCVCRDVSSGDACHIKHPMMMPGCVCAGVFKLGSGKELPGWLAYSKGHESNALWLYCAEKVLLHPRMVQIYRRNHLHIGDRMNGIRKFEDAINEAIDALEAQEQQLAGAHPSGNAAGAQGGPAETAAAGQINPPAKVGARIKRASCGGHLLENVQDHGRPYKEWLPAPAFWQLQQSRSASEYASQFVALLEGKPKIKAYLSKLPRDEWVKHASRAVQVHPDGGQFGFFWLPARSPRPLGGCIVRVVSPTKSRKIPTRNVHTAALVCVQVRDQRGGGQDLRLQDQLGVRARHGLRGGPWPAEHTSPRCCPKGGVLDVQRPAERAARASNSHPRQPDHGPARNRAAQRTRRARPALQARVRWAEALHGQS